MKTSLLHAGLLATAVALTAPLASAQKLVIKGSDTLGAKLFPILAEEFRARNPGVTFEIAAEGSTTGLAAIIDGTADIGMSSRQAKPVELSAGAAKGVNMVETLVCYDALGVIVNAANPVTNLRRRQVEQIFTGDVTDWASLGGQPGPVSVYTRNTASGTYSDWKDLAMRRRDYAESSQKMAGHEQIAAEVSQNRNGIGYVGLAYMNVPGTKVVSIDGAMPTKEAVNDKSYPYARPNFVYTNGEPQGVAKQFLEFVLSEDGQRIAEKVGFVPVR